MGDEGMSGVMDGCKGCYRAQPPRQFEMLTGALPFQGFTRKETMTKILKWAPIVPPHHSTLPSSHHFILPSFHHFILHLPSSIFPSSIFPSFHLLLIFSSFYLFVFVFLITITTPYCYHNNYHTTPHHTTPHHTISHHITPHHTTPHYTAPHHTTSHYISPHHTTPHHTISHHITPHHTTLYHTTPYLTTPHHTTPHHITSHQGQTGHAHLLECRGSKSFEVSLQEESCQQTGWVERAESGWE